MSITSKLQDMTVRTKVVVSFLDLLIAIAGIGSFATNRFSAIKDQLNDVTANWLPSVRYLEEIGTNAVFYREMQATYLMEANDADRAADLKKLDVIRGKIADNLAKYVPLIDTGNDERTYADAFIAKWRAYDARSGEFLSTLHSRGESAAKASFVGDYEDQFGDFHAALEKDIKFH